MKRCPDCGRDYNDDSLSFCLDDGTELLFGPAHSSLELTEPSTAFMASGDVSSKSGEEMGTKFLTPNSESSGFRSIAVLPFSNLSPDAGNEYFCDGLTEVLLNELATIDGLRVAARTSVFALKDRNSSAVEVGALLGVQSILSGSVQKERERLRITVQHVSTDNGFTLWSQRFDKGVSDIFDLQDEITRSVVDSLKVNLFGEPTRNADRRPTAPEAYDEFLRGKYSFNKMEERAVIKAIEHFKRSVELDPKFALGFASLSEAYIIAVNHASAQLHDSINLAEAAANKAMELDPMLPEAFIALGIIKAFYEWKWEEAERILRKAIELNPSSSAARRHLGLRLCVEKRFDEALDIYRSARDLDPLSPAVTECLGFPYYYSREYDRAIEEYLKTVDMEPEYKNVHFRLGIAYFHNGEHEKALQHLQKAQDISFDRDAGAWLGYAYGRLGQVEAARNVKSELEQLEQTIYVPPYSRAIVHLGLNEVDEAFNWLEKGVRERDYWMVFILSDPVLDPIRENPRFGELIELVGIPGH